MSQLIQLPLDLASIAIHCSVSFNLYLDLTKEGLEKTEFMPISNLTDGLLFYLFLYCWI